MRKMLLLAPLMLAGCGPTVYRDRVETVKVPVSVPCAERRPEEVQPLRSSMTKEQWNALSTDQRQALLLAQGMSRKAYGDKLYVATAGCPEQSADTSDAKDR